LESKNKPAHSIKKPIYYNKRGVFYNAKTSFFLSLLIVLMILGTSSVAAQHDADVTISPDIANCDELGNNTFTVNVKNNAGSDDHILQVEIYKALAGISNFTCGAAPTGWTLFSFTDRCIYVTELNSPDKIAPGEDLDFTFDAIMSSDSCESEFIVVTVDDADPTGDRVTNKVTVDIDCTPPEITKDVGEPKIANGNDFNYWITQNTLITAHATEDNNCDLGLDYCEITYTVDGGAPVTEVYQDFYPETYSWDYEWNFDEDSVHVINITCYDVAGNHYTLMETDKVDSTPPETTKNYGDPHFPEGINDGAPYPHWITTGTPITLTPTDGGQVCAKGVEKTWYLDTLIDNSYCEYEGNCQAVCPSPYEVNHVCSDESCAEWAQEQCQDKTGDEWYTCVENHVNECVNCDYEWKLYRGEPLYKDEESCHIIQFLSADYLGNYEDMNVQCVYVEDQPPLGEKWIGEPAIVEISPVAGDAEMYVVKVVNPTDSEISTDVVFQGLVKELSDWAGVDNNDVCFSFSEDISYYFDSNWGSCNGPNGNGCGPDYPGQTWEKWLASHPDWMDWYSTEGGCAFPDGDEYVVLSWNNGQISSPQTIPANSEAWGVIRLKFKNTGTFRFSLDSDLKIYHGGMPEDYLIWARDHVTPIELTCNDLEPHPVGGEKVCYKVSLDGTDDTSSYCNGDVDDNGFCCVDSSKEIIFNEDSNHELRYYCVDVLGNVGEVDTEYFKVDSQPPVINKTMIGEDHLGECPPEPGPDPEEPCYVRDDGKNGIHIEVQDDDTYGCTVGGAYCTYELWWFTTEDECKAKYPEAKYDYDNGKCPIKAGRFGEEGVDIYFSEDSTHWLYIFCWDALGNPTGQHLEEFLVDSTPPVTTKTYGEPTKVKDGYRWINSSTPITLTAEDVKVGVDKIYYRVTYVGDYPCPEDCQVQLENPGRFTEVSGDEAVFKITDESCHYIEFYAVDKLGNEEPHNSQCVMVDNTPPESVKTHGEPFIPDDGFDWVTKNTKITLDCQDRQPHPVEQETLCFKVSLDSDTNGDGVPDEDGMHYITDEYCLEGELDPGGYCCVYVGGEGSFEFTFQEDSYHNLEYYCRDHLRNDERDYNLANPPQEGQITDDGAWVQYYKVDSTPPTTTKTYIPDSYVDPETGYEYIDTKHEINLTAEDGGDVCAIGVDKIQYRVTGALADKFCENCADWMTSLRPDMGPWNTYTGPFGIGEESCHVIEYRSIDDLGNTEDINWQCVFVDKQPPIIEKTYIGPHYPVAVTHPKWINKSTDIKLNIYDQTPHPSGVKEVKYRYKRVGDEYCEDVVEDPTPCSAASADPEPWTTVTSGFDNIVFNIEEESCHLIEIYAEDNVGKNTLHKQCVFVDNQGPDPIKEVGEPKAKWDGQDSNFYQWISDKCWAEGEDSIDCWKVTMMTPISLECVDPEPHPVDHERVCFNVEVDGTDATEEYCEWRRGSINDDGFCCVDSTIEEFYFQEETEHNLKYYCEDALGNKGPVDEEKFKVEGTKFEIPLYKKWNLISVPFVLLNDDPEVVFNNTKDKIMSVWTYDPEHVICGEDCGEDWCVWTPGDDAPDNLKIQPGWGYWVLVDTDDEPEWLVIGGSLMNTGPVTPPSRNLVKGWNLIGYYGTSWELYDMSDANFVCGDECNLPDRFIYGDKAYCALNSLIDTQEGYPRWSSLWSYVNCGNHHAYWTGINTCADRDSPLQMALSRMYAGRGYWIEMDVEDMYAPATTCIWNDDFECRWTGGGIMP